MAAGEEAPGTARPAGVAQRLALLLIGAYRRWLSPYKGFRCAHAALHGGASCSQAVADIVAGHGLWQGRRHIRARFRACRAAYQALAANHTARRPPPQAHDPGRNRCARRCRDCADCSDCAGSAADTGSCLGKLPLRHCDDCACDCF